MCLLIVKPKSTEIPKDFLQAGFHRNDDGAGFAYVEDEEVKISKGYFEFDTFYQDYIQLTEQEELPALVHFRIATIGKVNEENCHPFSVGDMAMGHNGSFYDLGNSEISDTHHLANVLGGVAITGYDVTQDTFLSFLDPVWSRNKVAFLRPDGSFKIVNEQRGEWEMGVWYSNRGYLPVENHVRSERIDYAYALRQDTMHCESCEKVLNNPQEREDGLCVHCLVEIHNDLKEVDDDLPFDDEQKPSASHWKEIAINTIMIPF